MSDSFSESTATITATLAVPAHAIRLTAPPADTISQRTVEATTGVPPRAYLEAVRDPGFPLPVTRLGKLRIVNRAAFVAWLERGAFGRGRKDEGADEELLDDEEEDEKDEGEQAGEILDALGLVDAAPARGKRKAARKG